MMSKRLKYFISSLLSAIGFYMFVSLPYESRYYGLLVGMLLIIFCFWFGLGIIFEKSIYTRLMSILLPVEFFIGFGLFAAILPFNPFSAFLMSVFFGIICYFIFLVENVFLVAIGYKTVPLYRAAYTVSLIILLLSSFFLFDSLLSFKFVYWLNILITFVISGLIFLYQFWAIAIELPDDGKDKNLLAYVLVPAFLISQLALAFSFWPVGIFKGSIYLVSMIYVISGLLQVDIRERLFKRTWTEFTWIGIAIFLGILLMTSWR
jgi:hypothetical protein